MSPQHPLEKWQIVRVRRMRDEEWTDAVVILVSPNGRSLLLQLAGPVPARDGIMLNLLPLSVDYEKQIVSGVLTEDEYEIEYRP